MNPPDFHLLDIASRDVTCLPADASLGEAARLMAERHYSSIVVTDDARRPVGIVTERNILHAMRSGSPPDAPLRASMSAPVVTLPGDSAALEAYQTCLRESIRHLVLVDEQGVVSGVVSETDFRQHLNLTALAGRRQVLAVARHSVTSLPPHSSLLQALNLMQAQRESCVIVVDDERPVGIVTERDVVRFYSHDPDCVSQPLAKVMSSPVAAISATAAINEAAARMLELKVRHLAVVDETGRMLGLLSEHDLTRNMALGMLDERFEVDEIFLRTFIDTIPDLVWLKDRDGVYRACNRRFGQMWGVGEADLIGKTDRDFVSGELAEFFLTHDRAAMATGKPSVNEEWLDFADGYHGLFETVKTPMRDSMGNIIGVLGVAHDITERERTKLALQEREREFRTLAENLPDNIIRYDRACRVLYMNPAMERTIAPEILPIVGKLPFESDPDSEQIRGLQYLVEQVMDSGKRVEIEQEIPHPDGTLHWHHIIFVPERDQKGTVTGALGIGRDITERKKREWQLSQLNFALDRISEALYVMDEEGRFLYVNDEVCRELGYASEELGELTVKDIVPDWSQEKWKRRWQYLQTQGTATFETRHRARDGRIFPVEISANYFEYEGNGYNMSLVRDITERKRVEAQLEDYRRRLEGLVVEESSKFRALVEQSMVGIFIIQDGFFRYVNPGLVRMFGFDSPAEVIDKVSLLQFIRPEDKPAVEEIVRRLLTGEMQQGRHSFTALRRDGTSITIDVHGRRIEYQGRPAIIGSQVDITEMRRSQEELDRLVEEQAAKLVQGEELLRTLIEAIPDAIQFKDGEGHWLESNSAARAAFGLDLPTSQGRSDVELSGLAAPQFREALLQCSRTDEQAWKTKQPSRVVEVMQGADGDTATFDVIKVPLFNDDGSRKGLVIVGRDVSEIKRAEEALRVNASVFDNSQEAIVITDADNVIVDVNPAFSRITGYARNEVLGRDPSLLSSGQQDRGFYEAMWQALQQQHVWRGEIWNRRKNGEVYAELLSISAICDDAGKVQRYVGVFSDITYFKDHEAELSRVANFDALTGVPNRRLLADRLNQSIAHVQRSGKSLAVCYIDLDGFKDVNDRYGHETGDRLLVDITHRLQGVLRAGDTLARLGGDEFVLLFNDLEQETECLHILDRVMQTIAAPVHFGGPQITVSASIGVTFYPDDDEDGDTLMRHADQAMYTAKQSGKNRYHLYDPKHDKQVRSLHESRKRIEHGLDNGEFELYYQPKLELATNKVVGVEALIRWNHPEQGLLPPAEFLPLIENSELECRLGDWVLDTALAQLEAWQRLGLALEVGVNISARHLQSPDFVAELKRKLERHPELPPGSLQIEVLETTALEDMGQSSEVIEACRGLGVSFALDDFGTGYSSLVYLSKLGAETLKIDQSFVQGMQTSAGDHAIVKGVIALASTFGHATVAEGVEDGRLVQPLSELGCRYGQGYSIARPMPAGEFLAWFRKR
jgi:diguanylate cyclase (GGDEF)-like protein/PAS domain S-box-containing protein